MVPTLVRTLGLKGHRPIVGTRDNKDVIFTFAALNVVSGKLTTRLMMSEQRIRRRYGSHKTRVLQQAFASHLKDISRAYPAATHPRVVVTIDNAPWHAGQPIRNVLLQHPHVQLFRLPSYSPQLNVIERFWKVLRQRATHNRLFNHVTALRDALRAGITHFQAARRRTLSLILSDRRRAKLPAA